MAPRLPTAAFVRYWLRMTYLFFDIECANNFGGIGKMCSFGYVLCASDFSVIESDDLLMNPDAPFDWYLFKQGSKCQLAYSREDYQRQPLFTAFYERLRGLLAAEERLVLGFGGSNDIATIATECVRYDCEPIDFACYDIRAALEAHYQQQGSLRDYVSLLGIDTAGRDFHDSRADALFTMQVTARLCADSNKPLAALVAAYPPATSSHALSDRKKKLYRRVLERAEAQKTAAAPESARRRRIPKRITVPANFDFRAEILRELQRQKANDTSAVVAWHGKHDR